MPNLYDGKSLLPERMSLFTALMYCILEYLIKEGKFYEFSKMLGKGLPELENFQEGERKLQAVITELKTELSKKVGNEEEIMLTWVNQCRTADNDMFHTAQLLSDIFYEILKNYRSIIKETKKKIWNEKTPKEFIEDAGKNKTITDEYIDCDTNSRINVNVDTILCYTLSTLLRAPVRFINIAAATFNDDIETTISSSEAIFFDDKFDSSWLRGRDRSYTLIYESNQWMVCYKTFPYLVRQVTMQEMVLPLICRVCDKEIYSLDIKNKERLFIPERCKYRHKYHLKCLRNRLKELHGDVVKVFMKSSEDYGLPQIICFQCGYKLTHQDIKVLFYKEYEEAFKEQIIEEFDEDFLLYESQQKIVKDKRGKLFYSKLLLSNYSPYIRDSFDNFAVRKHPKAKNGEKYDKEQINKILKTNTNISLQRYCTQCGEFLNDNSDKMPLSCGHHICHNCGKEWITFSIGNYKYFVDYIDMNIDWPITKCLHCNKIVDIGGVQIHKDHYISFPMFVRRCFIEKDLSCIECNSKDDNNYGTTFRVLRDGLKKGDINDDDKEVSSPLLSYSKIPSEDLPYENLPSDIIDILNIWLKHYYAQIKKIGSSESILIGYKKMFEEVKKKVNELLNGPQSIKDRLNEIKKDFENLAIPQDNLNTSIKGFIENECKKLFCYDTFVDCRVYCDMYRSKINFKTFYYLCLNGATLDQIKNIGSNIMPLLSVTGPFGRGFYISKDASVIHQMSKQIDGYYYIAQVYLATKMKPKKDETIHNLINPYRTCGYSQIPEEEKKGKGKDESKRYHGVSMEEMIKVNIDEKEIMVVFEPCSIVPFQLIQYSIDFSKMA